MTQISEGAPAHEAPTENGDVRGALPYGKSSEDIYVWFVDIARPGGKCVRYLSDPRPGPGFGFWKTYGCCPPELISPFAVTGIDPGRHGVVLTTANPKTGERRLYEGSIDNVASDLYRAGQRYEGRRDRQALFWAINDLCAEIKRQRAARGVEV